MILTLNMDGLKARFNADRVLSAVDRAKKRNLSKQAAFTRRSAKSSIRRRRRTSVSGSPPSSHSGLLRKLIYFVYMPSTQSVVIGPMLTNQVQKLRKYRIVQNKTVPETLETGGRVTRTWVKSGRSKRVYIQPRPFMRPALIKGTADLEKYWKDTVK